MGFLIFVAVMWFIISLARNAAKQAQQKSQVIVPPPDWFATAEGLPESHVRRLAVPAAVLPPRSGREESTSELLLDETAADHDLDLSHAEVVSLEAAVPRMSVAPRPLPPAAASLETEVDWEQEHQRFHQRYVEGHAQAQAPIHGLMDDLRDPAGARRAVLMAEILGPPVSMRR
ncbi:hypothetical protein [Longimicrobium sp.]|uniref:hypothetical protein n=1 Tax=Longimicrobium sp. TaxID=2029185 RepID=UPI002E2F8057|nr:hypothetical protein [Longimicrobium sp.]HEX6039632.1 hypothetical protein [Longimicrobium sp.]